MIQSESSYSDLARLSQPNKQTPVFGARNAQSTLGDVQVEDRQRFPIFDAAAAAAAAAAFIEMKRKLLNWRNKSSDKIPVFFETNFD